MSVRAVLLMLVLGSPGAAGSDTVDGDPAVSAGAWDIGGYALWLRCTGTGEPTILIDGGAGTWSTHYLPVQRALVGAARTCVYDRAGLGRSDVGAAPRSSALMVSELYRLLRAAGETPPYVLVGHSLGGYNVRIFQSRFPDDVAALVLVDAAHPQQWEKLPPAVSGLVKSAPSMLRQMAAMADAQGLNRAMIDAQVPQTFPADVREELVDAGLSAHSYSGAAAEFEAALTSGAQVPRDDLGDLPLVVLTARNSAFAYAGPGIPAEEANRAWLELQEELATLSTRTERMFSDGTHALHETHPNDIARAVRRAILMVNTTPDQR